MPDDSGGRGRGRYVHTGAADLPVCELTRLEGDLHIEPVRRQTAGRTVYQSWCLTSASLPPVEGFAGRTTVRLPDRGETFRIEYGAQGVRVTEETS